MPGQGFASLSAEKRRIMGKKGAEAARMKGRKHNWNPVTAKMASKKAAETRRRNNLVKAATKLRTLGFTDAVLIGLTHDDILKYAKSPKKLTKLLNTPTVETVDPVLS